MPKSRKTLTAKEWLFCRYYARTQNPRESAARAGYGFMPERSGEKLLETERVRAELEKLSQKDRCTAQKIEAGFYRLAFGSISDAVRLIFSDELKNADEIEKMDLFNVSEIKRPKGGGVEIKFFDRLKALERLLEISSLQNDNGTKSFFEALEKGAAGIEAE